MATCVITTRALNSKKKPYCSLFGDLHRLLGVTLIEIKYGFGFKYVPILVVDDNEPGRSIQTLLGSRKGWLVCGEAADGLQAVEEGEIIVARPDHNGCIDAKHERSGGDEDYSS